MVVFLVPKLAQISAKSRAALQLPTMNHIEKR